MVIKVYLFDNSPESVKTLQEIKAALSNKSDISLEIIDVSRNAMDAIQAGVFVTPMTIIANHGIMGVPKKDEIIELLECTSR